jgi:ubiquitin carboxyl-terminal hydrolase L5
LDHLDAALALQNEVDSEERAKSLAARRSKKKTKRQSNTADKSGGSSAYHFIAYVPVGHQVWQLDGLEPNPDCIGKTQFHTLGPDQT